MRKEIDLDLGLSVSKEVLLDHHSVLILLNVLHFELDSFLKKVDNPTLDIYREFVIDLLITIGERKLEANRDEIESGFLKFANDLRDFGKQNKSFEEQVDILLDIVKVAINRIEEFKKDRFEWKLIPVGEIRSTLDNFLKVMEKVSRERFQVVYPPKEPGEHDYLIQLEVVENRKHLFAPPVIHDIIRDLAANSRKYSPTGSTIQIILAQIEKSGLKLAIKDEGVGIPEEEVINVVKFKHRASNVSEIRSMGEGFGLTKAYHICKYFGGSFVIDTELNNGTSIELTMFPPSKSHNGNGRSLKK